MNGPRLRSFPWLLPGALGAACFACGASTRTTNTASEAPGGASARPAAESAVAGGPLRSPAPSSKSAGQKDEGDDPVAAHPNAQVALARVSTLDAPQPVWSGPSSIRLEIGESGPDAPWTLVLANVGQKPQRLVADPHLLRLDVEVPGREKPVACALPDTLFPDDVNSELEITLEPGEAVLESFDPRLYCFADPAELPLVPGARVTPHFGWKTATKIKWERGKRIELPDPKAPYVASALPQGEAPPTEQVTELEGSAFELGSTYGVWSRADAPSSGRAEPFDEGDRDDDERHESGRAAESDRKPREGQPAEPHESEQEPPPFALRVVRGSDAASRHEASVVVELSNRSRHALPVFVRHESLSFDVLGPEGLVHCNAEPDDRAPDRAAFQTLGPGNSLSLTARLMELCPSETFERAGLYLIRAEFDSSLSGNDFGLSAFVGHVRSRGFASVRIRSGPVPLFAGHHMTRIQTGLELE